MAWLHGAPKQYAKQENPKSRLSNLTDDHPAKCLPEINGFLSLCFQLSGFCLNGSMGSIPFTWSEIKSFSDQSGYKLSGWESEQIILMSRSYCYMATKAKELGCPPPYQEGVSDEEEVQKMRDRVSKQWDSFGSGLKKK